MSAVFPLILLSLVTVVVYARSCVGSFVYDDLWYIVRNPAMHEPLSWMRLWADSAMTAATVSGLQTDVYRPLTTLWFWLDAHVWGPWTLPYHVENLALHLLNGWLLYKLLRRWLPDYPESAWIGTAIFWLHPVQVESVAWISQRSTLASTTLILSGLLAFLHDRPRWGLLAAALALFVRETAVVFPVLWLLALWVDQDLSPRAVWRKPSLRRTGLALITLVVGYLVIRWSVLGQVSQIVTPSLRENASMGVMAFTVYVGQILLPLNLRVSYTYPVIQWATFLTAVLVLLAYGDLIRRSWNRLPFLAGGLMWVLVCLLPVLQIVPIRAFVAERFLYLPLIGVALVAASFCSLPRVRVGVSIWILFLTVQTLLTVPVWRTEHDLWKNAAGHDPRNAYAQINYASTLNDAVLARDAFQLALQTCPNPSLCHAAQEGLRLTEEAIRP